MALENLPPVAVLRHAPQESLGFIESSLLRYGLPYHYYDFYNAQSSLHPSLLSALIVLGGAQSVNANLDFLALEAKLLQNALASSIPILAVCLGAQLLAKTLGAVVSLSPTPEVGFFPVSTTSAASTDPLFHDWSTESVMHWHNEAFALPAGAVHLASSEACANQAFRFGDRAWGMQFHLEVTPKMIARWCTEDEACGADRELTTPIDPHFQADRLRSLATRVFDRWASLVARYGRP